LGAFHGSEAILLFKVPIHSDHVTDSVGDNLIDMWTRFAKTGNPNGGMNVTWSKYTRDGDQYLDIWAVPIVRSGY
jgi:para-nitrobenzyl esterase